MLRLHASMFLLVHNSTERMEAGSRRGNWYHWLPQSSLEQEKEFRTMFLPTEIFGYSQQSPRGLNATQRRICTSTSANMSRCSLRGGICFFFSLKTTKSILRQRDEETNQQITVSFNEDAALVVERTIRSYYCTALKKKLCRCWRFAALCAS